MQQKENKHLETEWGETDLWIVSDGVMNNKIVDVEVINKQENLTLSGNIFMRWQVQRDGIDNV